jgi:pyruvate-ferredoxin/flavodoxin oxidoreductase
MIDNTLVAAHRERGLPPDHPFIRGTAQNSDVYFQAREAANPYYQTCPALVEETMKQFAALTGRHYHLFEYAGAPDAKRVMVLMGSGAETAEETAKYLAARGEKVGVVKVHLFPPFSVSHFLQSLPATVKTIIVLDRTKEPGSIGEPLYLDVVTALNEGWQAGALPCVIGGRYGLSSKEFTSVMVKGSFDEMRRNTPMNHFTVGIDDDVTHTSIAYDPSFSIDDPSLMQCVFWGLSSDGTVGANKNSIKIVGEETENYAQGYFVYDSKKSGSVTISHLRFGPHPIHAPYLIGKERATFVACHQYSLLERFDVLKYAQHGGIFLLNSVYSPEEVWEHVPIEVRQAILQKGLHMHIIDAYKVASSLGMGACEYSDADLFLRAQRHLAADVWQAG